MSVFTKGLNRYLNLLIYYSNSVLSELVINGWSMLI